MGSGGHGVFVFIFLSLQVIGRSTMRSYIGLALFVRTRHAVFLLLWWGECCINEIFFVSLQTDFFVNA